jgi:tetratricopeptide (TPR) repeat protein
MDQRTVTEDSLVNYQSFFQYFLLISLLLLIAEFFIPERIVPRVKSKLKLQQALPIALLFCSFTASAQDEKATIKKGNDAYKKNEFENAAALYQKVITKTPANATAQYNMGNALYKNNKKNEAVEAYDNAASNSNTKEEKSKAYYNKGVVLQNDKKLPECIAAYKNALKLNPQDEDARQNLQKALQQLQQQQKKDQQKENQQKQQQKKEQEKNQPKPPEPKITKKDAEEKLKALLQQEKNLQDKLRKVNVAAPNKPEKDW